LLPEGSSCGQIARFGGWEEAHAKEVIYRRITPQAVINCRFLPDQGQKLNVLARLDNVLRQLKTPPAGTP
jgi:hypothetical protein